MCTPTTAGSAANRSLIAPACETRGADCSALQPVRDRRHCRSGRATASCAIGGPDESGNQSIGLVVSETNDSGRIAFQDRFDGTTSPPPTPNSNDAITPERAHPTRKGRRADPHGPYARIAVIWMARSRPFRPGLRIENRSRSLFPPHRRGTSPGRRGTRRHGDVIPGLGPVMCWLSKRWVVARMNARPTGRSFPGRGYTSARSATGCSQRCVRIRCRRRGRGLRLRRGSGSARSPADWRYATVPVMPGEAMMAAMRAHDANRVVEPYAGEFV